MILDIPGVSDRRQSPRYEIEIAVDMVLADDSILTVNTHNISSCGIQVLCDRWATNKIEPRGIHNYAINHLRLKVVTALPFGNETKKLYTNCRIMSAQRMSQDEYMLNLVFLDFENGTEKILNDFLGQYQQKTTVVNATA